MNSPRAWLAGAAAVLVLGGCEDVGLEDRNLLLEEAAHRPPDALVQAVHPHVAGGPEPSADGTAAVTIGEQTFQASGLPLRVAADQLRPVGSTPAGAVSVARWDEPPYDRLYLEQEEGFYVSYSPVYGDGDPAARLEAGRHALESGAAAGH